MNSTDTIKSALLQDTRRIVTHLLPEGVEHRGEWMVGSTAGEKGKSMRIRLDGDKAGVWLDAATGDKGDIIKLWQAVTGLNFKEAMKEITTYLGLPDEESERLAPSKAWQQLQREMGTGTADDIATLAKQRKLPTEAGIVQAVENGHLFFGPVYDADTYIHSWIITDAARLAAQARRCDGQPYGDGQKGKTIHGTTGRWPIGIAESALPEIALVEGGPDFLAAYTALALLGLDHIQPVAILGSSQTIHPDALPLFQNKRVWMFPHADDNYAGLSGALNWERALRTVNATVLPFDFTHYAGVKDLNDYVAQLTAHPSGTSGQSLAEETASVTAHALSDWSL